MNTDETQVMGNSVRVFDGYKDNPMVEVPKFYKHRKRLNFFGYPLFYLGKQELFSVFDLSKPNGYFGVG